MRTSNLLAALDSISPSAVEYIDWLRVGMALKHEGCTVDVWDRWSARDTARYHAGECAAKWETFHEEAGQPVTGATIYHLAGAGGWTDSGTSSNTGGVMEWNDVITDDSNGADPTASESDAGASAQQLKRYLSALFRPGEYVAYVIQSKQDSQDGKFKPFGGVYYRTAGELIAALDKYAGHSWRDCFGYAFGDYDTSAGAWICINPVDGHGRKKANVTRYTYTLIESDEIPQAEQVAQYKALQLPIAAMVDSGGKSIHAVVHVDAKDASEYKERVTFLHEYLNAHGLPVDASNKDESRLSRLPEVMRGERCQKLLGVNIGRRDWANWYSWAVGNADDLPPITSSDEIFADTTPLASPLIDGVLRSGQKMLISGSSKIGKSFLLLELAAAIATGRSWLGFPCARGRVLYINFEIAQPSFFDRYKKVAAALGVTRADLSGQVDVWNLRGYSEPLDKLTPKILQACGDSYSAIIIDPLYKTITGDENSASDMAKFCNEFDRIAEGTKAAVIYCHHHSKGAQSGKAAIDRASGSGVFGRDPDAILDVIELDTAAAGALPPSDGARAFRMESNLREFKDIKPLNFWFSYPVHVLDVSGDLTGAPVQGRSKKPPQATEAESKDDAFRHAVEALYSFNGEGAAIDDIAAYLGCTAKTVRNRVAALKDEFVIQKGRVRYTSAVESDGIEAG